MEACPCGSGKSYGSCCQPFHAGKAKAPSAEALMRSRYSAYAKHQIDYILATYTKSGTDEVDREGTQKWAEESSWEGLEILGTDKGSMSDLEGMVEFRATYVQNGIRERHHEKANFVKQDGVWLYDTGSIVQETRVRVGEKIGRNDPCPCGSGKKYKLCCGR